MNNVNKAEESIEEKYRINKATSSENVQTQRAKKMTPIKLMNGSMNEAIIANQCLNPSESKSFSRDDISYFLASIFKLKKD